VFAQGELTITAAMESLGNSLFMDVVPESWAKRAYPSLYGLSQWYADMLQRVKELESWTGDFQLPAAVWLAGFFNPQSFLTAIMQQVNCFVVLCSISLLNCKENVMIENVTMQPNHAMIKS